LWRRFLRYLIRDTALALVVVLVVFASWDYASARRLRAEIDRIRAAGEPISFGDLGGSSPKIPDAENAGRLYEAAMALASRVDNDRLDRLRRQYLDVAAVWPREAPSHSLEEEAELFLKEHRRAIEFCHQAASVDKCSFRFMTDEGIVPCMERLSQIGRLAELISLHTLSHSLKGWYHPPYYEGLLNSFRMLRLFDQDEPIVVEHVRQRLTALAIQDLIYAVERRRHDEADMSLGDLNEAISAIEKPGALTRVIQAERLSTLATLDKLEDRWTSKAKSRISSRYSPSAWFARSWAKTWLRSEATIHLRSFADVIRASRDPWPQVLDSLQRDAAIESDAMIGLSMGLFRQASINEAKSVALSRCAVVAVMIRSYRQKYDRFPADLKQVVPEFGESIPLDPFSGRKIRYTRKRESAVIYSIGPDQFDFSGRIQTDQNDESPDWGLRIRGHRVGRFFKNLR
jgi:hypothetical protein